MKNIITCGLAIIDGGNGNIIIGEKEKKDLYVENLSWVFPAGRLESLNFEDELKKIIKEKVDLDIYVEDIVYARLIPDIHRDDVRVMALYFYCRLKEGTGETKKGFKEVKWIPATQIFKYFATSTADEVVKVLRDIQLRK